MPYKQIVRYYSRWDFEKHDGRVALYDSSYHIVDNRVFSDAQEFQVIVEMLRYEKPLWFDTKAKQLMTGHHAIGEPVGEEEG